MLPEIMFRAYQETYHVGAAFGALQRRMRSPGQSILATVEIPTDFHLALGASLHEVLPKAQHALLIGIETFARKTTTCRVIPRTRERVPIEETLCLGIPKIDISITSVVK